MGSMIMLIVTGLVILGCFWLFPKLLGQTDFQFDARTLVVAFDPLYDDLSPDLDLQEVSAEVKPEETSVQPLATPPVFVTAPKTVSFQLTATGTVNINSAVQKAMTDDSGYHFSDLFSALTEDIRSDLSIVTLENTVIPTEKLTNTNVPTDVFAALKECGFNAVCLGYNGILNSGISGLSATKDASRAEGLTPYGVYASEEERGSSLLLDANGVSVALLSYQNELTATGKKKASKEEQSFAIASPTIETITQDILTAKSAGAQVVVVSLCWGKESATSPTKAQRELAQGIADAGADIILGTFSNALQQVELLTANRSGGKRSQTLCAYSLGSFFTPNREKRTSISGILLHANVTYDLSTDTVTFDQLSYTPTYVWRGKKTEKTVYAVLPSDLTPPTFMQSDQASIMARCLTIVRDVMEESNIPQREPGQIFLDSEE